MKTIKTRFDLMLTYFRFDLLAVVATVVALVAVSAILHCGETVEKTVQACPQGYAIQEGVCSPIVDGELVCGAVRTFQINFIDAVTKQPLIFPIATTMQNRETLADSNGRHRLNDSDGTYLFNSIVLCDEYDISAIAVCYEIVDRVSFQIPLATFWTVELTPKTNCTNSELDAAFAACVAEAGETGLCCLAFQQAQFDTACNRL